MARYVNDYILKISNIAEAYTVVDKYWSTKGFGRMPNEACNAECDIWYRQCPNTPIMQYCMFFVTPNAVHVEAWMREAYSDGGVSSERSFEEMRHRMNPQLFMTEINGLIAILQTPVHQVRNEYIKGYTPPPPTMYAEPQQYARPLPYTAVNQQMYPQAQNPYGAQQMYNPPPQVENSKNKAESMTTIALVMACIGLVFNFLFSGLSFSTLSILPIVSIVLMCSGDAKSDKGSKKIAGMVIASLAIAVWILKIVYYLFRL